MAPAEDLVGRRGPRATPARPSLPPLAKRIPAGATIRRQYVLCGKCPRRHGPYWYAAWFAKGRTRTAYIGSDRALSRFLAMRDGGDVVADAHLVVDEDLDDDASANVIPMSARRLDEALLRFERAAAPDERDAGELVALIGAGLVRRVKRVGNALSAHALTPEGQRRARAAARRRWATPGLTSRTMGQGARRARVQR